MQYPDVADYVPVNAVIDGVYISGWRATDYQRELRAAGIFCVLKLYDGSPDFRSDFNALDMGINDGEYISKTTLARGAQYILREVKAGNRVLVMCGAGISRSSTFVLAYLLETGHDLGEAFALLRDKRPQADPHPMLWQSLIDHYALKYTLKDVMEWSRR